MKLFGEDRDILIQKNVRLVQSGYFKYNINKLHKKEINGINSIISFNYMGSSEFEWGSLPHSLRRMTINKDFYKVFVFNEYKDANGKSLKVYAPIMFFKNVKNIVDRLAIEGYGLQEYCSLKDHIKNDKNKKSEKNELIYCFEDNNNFWWDIENDFFMFFEHTDKLLMAMDALRKRNFEYDKNINKNLLYKQYIKELTKPNIYSYMNSYSSIKDCFYDETNKSFFIEFLENANLENILMESMIIAKFNESIVRFNINGVNFTIDKDTALDKIIKENGINIIDSCTYSDNINKLIFSYNQKIEKQEQEKQLVYVLKQIRDKKI